MWICRLSCVATALSIAPTISLAEMQFTDVTIAANILHTYNAVGDFGHQEYTWMTGGAVAEDFDGDGWIDIYVLQGGELPNLLYLNQQDGTFLDEASNRGAALVGAHVGACAADFDGDGDIDIFVSAATSPHILLINDGLGYFSVNSQGINEPSFGATSPSWGDLDNDGLLDLMLGAWRDEGKGDLKIYRNTGGGQLQLYQSLAQDWTFTPRFADFDGDRFQDLLIVADFGNTTWYRNDGFGQFQTAGTSDVENGMGTAVGDIDNDGDLDVFISSIRDFDEPDLNWGTTGNRLLLNDGSGEFADITGSAGVRDGFWGWGSAFADFDNDGDLDLYHVNGWPANNAGVPAQFNETPARLFENLGDNTFQEISTASGDAGDTGQGRCVVVFDYDNDGDLDLFVTNNSVLVVDDEFSRLDPGPPVLLRNDSRNSNQQLSVRLVGTEPPHHTHGIGSRVYVTTGDVIQMRELHASSGFNGHGPGRIAHFGLGASSVSDVVRVVWSNGDEIELYGVETDQILIASPRATVSQRAIIPGGSVTAEIAVQEVPLGATAEWTIDDMVFGNPVTVTLTTPGTHALRVKLFSGDIPRKLIRSETVMVIVRSPESAGKSIARRWNEQNLAAIRIDFPEPTTHARNLFYTSVAMWDAWAAYDSQALGFLHNESASPGDIEATRRESISYAAFRVLSERYANSVNSNTILASLNLFMTELGLDPANTNITGSTPSALGNRVARTVLDYAASDGWADPSSFLNGSYTPTNNPLPVAESGAVMNDPNRWQPLLFQEARTQNEHPADLIQSFLDPHWGGVRPFALASLAERNLYFDPGAPPELGGATDIAFKQGNVDVIMYSSWLDPTNGIMIDISPGVIGNNTLGLNDGTGHMINPAEGLPYASNIVNLADFGRVLAEYWADGPASETPPGHWNVLANEVSDTPNFERKIGGVGPSLDPLEWDVKLYFALNGALHDAAISAWGCKRIYDFVRPISSIRYMGGRGQSSDPGGLRYDPQGLPLVQNLIEVITTVSSTVGERHAHLAGHIGEVALRAWSAKMGVGWILATDWLPYQRDTFVTPAFPGYVSGHSTFSRAAAEVLVRITGDEFFPGGMGSFVAKQGEYLAFESGPASDVILQWATYYDAADQSGQSRIYGGIHVPADDGPGRIIGSQCGIGAWNLASSYYDGSIVDIPFATRLFSTEAQDLKLEWNATRGAWYRIEQSDNLSSGVFTDVCGWVRAWETMETLHLDSQFIGWPSTFFRVVRSHQAP